MAETNYPNLFCNSWIGETLYICISTESFGKLINGYNIPQISRQCNF